MKFSIVTPSYNQGKFIERTIESVIRQKGDFDLEYIVIDGGSSDGTLEVLRRYSEHLRWTSEPDRGQSDAINKGFEMASGDVLAWLNSDDTYQPGALQAVADAYRASNFAWCFGDCRVINEIDQEIRPYITEYKIRQSRAYSFRRLLRRDFISQPAVFFARKAYEQVGPLDLDLHYAMDYDYWLRLGRQYEPHYINRFLANFRWHEESKNSRRFQLAAREAYELARRHAKPEERLNVMMHYAHFQALRILYRFI